jgi:predicted secreted protein
MRLRIWMRPAQSTLLTAFLLTAGITGARADTILHLSVPGEVQVQPDEIVATLRAEANGASAAAAQATVNTMMAAALARTHAAEGITATTENYFVSQNSPLKPNEPRVWHAAQSVQLTGHDGGAMLNLVGTLQQAGLALDGLIWRISPARAETARAEATDRAIKALRSRAVHDAALLDLRLIGFDRVAIEDLRPGGRPVPFRAAVMNAAPAPPPSAESGPITVSVTVEADARLGAPGEPPPPR